MCERVGLSVARLRRVSEGSLRLGKLRTGCWRPLSEAELAALRREIWIE
jgi:16S rRNA U516 pseudouridylate synthase RsuA-like enzyme